MKRKTIKILIVLLILIISSSIIPIEGKKTILNQNKIKEKTQYTLLIIAPKQFYKYLTPLVEHKNNHNMKTKLVTLENVYKQTFWEGRDKPEKIKYFIKKALEEWNIKYVLLVGGRKNQGYQETWWMPVRYTHLERKYGNYNENKFLTDLYFADIYDKNGNFSSWDDNNNGVFGEWPLDQPALDIPDLYPDVSVGRLPCRNIYDVIIGVRKIINYETSECSDSWFKKMLVIGGDTYTKKTEYNDGEVYTQMGLDRMPSFKPVKLYASDGTLKSWLNVVKEINNGCGFVFFSGHGGPHLWSTFLPNDSKTSVGTFRLIHIPFLFNINKLPVCVSASGCFNNMFNVSITKSEWVYYQGIKYNIPRCWGEALTLKPFGGCIAVIASTAFSYESSDINSEMGGCEWLDIHFFEEYGLKDIDIIGDIWSNTVTSFLQNFSINWCDNSSDGDALIVKNCEQWLLLGDPSLKIGGYN